MTFMEKEKTCAFFGHRNIEDKALLFTKILEIIENLIKNQNFAQFLFGGYGEFDELCHCAVTALREKYPLIKRVFCYSNEKEFCKLKSKGIIKNYEYEDFKFIPLVYDYWYTRIYFRNCKMVDESDCIIFYVTKNAGSGAYKILQYAQKSKKEIINVSEMENI